MKSIHMNCSDRYLYHCTYSSIICFCRLHWSRISDCLSYDFVVLTALNRRAFDMTVWLHSRCFIAVNSDRTYHVAVIHTTHHHRTLRFADEDDDWAFSTEVLFHFFVCTSLSDNLSVFEHHDRYSRSTSRSWFCIDDASHKSSQDEQLLLLLSNVAMLLDKRKFDSSSETTNQLIYSRFNHEYYVETEMGKADSFVSDAVKHSFLNLYQFSLHR